jgi:hypothetical protein
VEREPQTPREAGVVRAGANVKALRRIQAIAVDEQDTETGKRLTAPASWRPGGVRTALDVQIEAKTLALAAEHRLDVALGALPFLNPGLP